MNLEVTDSMLDELEEGIAIGNETDSISGDDSKSIGAINSNY